MTERKPSSTPSEAIDKSTFISRQELASAWFQDLRDRIRAAFEAIEDEAVAAHPELGAAGRFEEKPWQRDGGGGGVMSIMKGQVFEKGGVNTSEVYGTVSDQERPMFQQLVAKVDPVFQCDTSTEFNATGISLVIHPKNPFVPTVHANFRWLHLQQ